jgi:hypothetical protein
MAEKYYKDVLDRYAPVVRVCKRSKPWWNEEIKDQRKIAGRAKRLWMHSHVQREKLKKEEKTLYRTIRKYKRRCWENGNKQLKERMYGKQCDAQEKEKDETFRPWRGQETKQ